MNVIGTGEEVVVIKVGEDGEDMNAIDADGEPNEIAAEGTSGPADEEVSGNGAEEMNSPANEEAIATVVTSKGDADVEDVANNVDVTEAWVLVNALDSVETLRPLVVAGYQ